MYSSRSPKSWEGLTLYLCATPSSCIILGLLTKWVKCFDTSLRIGEYKHHLIISQLNACILDLLIGRLNEARITDCVKDLHDITHSTFVFFIHGTIDEKGVGRLQQRVGDSTCLNQGKHRGTLQASHKRLTLGKRWKFHQLTHRIALQNFKTCYFHCLLPHCWQHFDIGDLVGWLTICRSTVDCVFWCTELVIFGAERNGNTLAVRIGTLLIASDQASSVIDGGVDVALKLIDLFLGTSDRRCVAADTKASISITLCSLLSSGPILDGATLKDLHQLSVEHVVGQSDGVASDGDLLTFLSNKNTFYNQLDSVGGLGLNRKTNFCSSCEGDLISLAFGLACDHCHIDSCNFVALFCSHNDFLLVSYFIRR
nr:MAG TPA: hypothetical protein [Caudoviricetes sp.]